MSKSTNHGELTVPPAPEPPFRPIPRALSQMAIILGISHEAAKAAYGLWQLELLRDTRIAGRNCQAGDRVTVTGNIAVGMVLDGQARFDDAKMEEEIRILEAARRIKALPAAAMPQFQQPHPRAKQSGSGFVGSATEASIAAGR